jgi:protein-S-isoprenylcysteine O-methyltransferase Ste14
LLAVFPVFLPLGGLQYWRSRLEERALVQVFPNYEDYRRRTWRLLAGVH